MSPETLKFSTNWQLIRMFWQHWKFGKKQFVCLGWGCCCQWSSFIWNRERSEDQNMAGDLSSHLIRAIIYAVFGFFQFFSDFSMHAFIFLNAILTPKSALYVWMHREAEVLQGILHLRTFGCIMSRIRS